MFAEDLFKGVAGKEVAVSRWVNLAQILLFKVVVARLVILECRSRCLRPRGELPMQCCKWIGLKSERSENHGYR
jgi:hypothetical protein